MDDLGLVTMVLLLGVGFALYVGGPSICTFQGLSGEDCASFAVPGFFDFINLLATGDFSTLANTYIFTPLNGIIAVGAFGIALYTGSSDTLRTTLALTMLMTIANIFFVPLAYFRSIGGTEIVAGTGFTMSMFVVGFFNLLLILTIVSFVMERRW